MNNDEFIDGGVINNSNYDAPKEIKSKEITKMSMGFFLFDPWSRNREGKHYFFIIDKDEDGNMYLSDTINGNNKILIGEDLLKEAQKIIDDNNLVNLNGTVEYTSGLPVEFSPEELTVDYKSDEHLHFLINGYPYSKWQKEFVKLFGREYLRNGNDKYMPPKETLTLTRFDVDFDKDYKHYLYAEVIQVDETKKFMRIVYDKEKQESVDDAVEIKREIFDKVALIIEENGFSDNDKVVMFHGVSVGEINALENLVKRTKKDFPEYKIVVTTGTHTGQDLARKKLDKVADLITYFPADFPVVINKFLNKINPDKVFIAETEIWPNFAIECKKRGINIYIINGRISDSTFKSYNAFKFIFKYFLSFYTGIYTQSNEDNEKFIKLGANPMTTQRMNNLKFDVQKPIVDFEFDKNNSKIFLAGSTHKGEDEIILYTFRKLRDNHPDLKLIIAPRHLTRTEEIRALTESFGYKYDFRSNAKKDLNDIDVLIMDTLGELGKMYSFADIAFIGGSFNKTGGHNPLEAAIFEKPVISGPSIHNFKDIYNIIKNAGAGFVVEDKDSLYEISEKLLSDNDFYNKTVDSSAKVFQEQQGALEFVLKLLN